MRKSDTTVRARHLSTVLALALKLSLVFLLLVACGSPLSGERPAGGPAGLATGTPAGEPSPSSSPATVSPTPFADGPGWTRYLGVNDVRGLALAPDGALWAATSGGAVRWDLSTDTYLQYAAADGLAATEAQDVALGGDGTPWVATTGGLSHLVGATWKTYTTADGLASDTVLAVAVAPDGMVWVGTAAGASQFDGRSWRTFLGGVSVWDVAVASDGAVWLATDVGVQRYQPERGAWTAYGRELGLTSLKALLVAVGPEGDVWADFVWDGVYHFDGKAWHRVYGAGGLLCDLAVATDGTPWIGACGSLHYSWGKLLQREGNAWPEVPIDDGLADLPVQAIAFGPDGVIAAGTSQGIHLREAGKWRMLRGGPTRNVITAVAVMPDGSAWLAYGDSASDPAGGGVSRFDGQNWQYFLGNANVQALTVGTDGTLWAGAGCEVERFDGQEWQATGLCEAPDWQGNVIALAAALDGTAWAASGLKLAHFDDTSWTVSDRLVSSLAVAPDGTLWVAGWEGSQASDYLGRFDGREWTIYKAADTPQGALKALVVTPDGTLWGSAGAQGVGHFDGKSYVSYSAVDGMPLVPVHSLAVGPDGALWVAGSGGLARYDGQGWQAYPVSSGVDANIRTIACAEDGSLWLGTNDGVVRWTGK